MFDWIQSFGDWLIYSVFQISQGSKLGDALNFFVYDTLKILILLFLITSVMGVVNSYFPVDKVRNFLSRNKLYGLEYFLLLLLELLRHFALAVPFHYLLVL